MVLRHQTVSQLLKAYLLVEPDLSFTNEKSLILMPKSKFRNALEASKIELTKIRNNAEKQLGPDKAAIFDAHLLVLDDPELIQPIEDKIANEK